MNESGTECLLLLAMATFILWDGPRGIMQIMEGVYNTGRKITMGQKRTQVARQVHARRRVTHSLINGELVNHLILFLLTRTTTFTLHSCKMTKRPSSTRVDMSILEKVAKLDAYYALPFSIRKSQRHSAKAIGTTRSTLCRMLEKEEEIRQDAKDDRNLKISAGSGDH